MHRSGEIDSEPDSERAGTRSAADTSVLLIELERALKACEFYPKEDPLRTEVVDRCLRAWRCDLERSGPVTLELRRGAFWFPNSDVPVSHGGGEDLARRFVLRGLGRVTISPDLDASALREWVALLLADPETLDIHEGSAELRVGNTLRVGQRELDCNTDADDSKENPEVTQPTPLEPIGVDVPTLPGVGAFELDPETTLTGLSPLVGNSHLGPPERSTGSASAASMEIEAILDELEDCEEDRDYRDLASTLADHSERRIRDGFLEEGYRAIALLARHAGDDQKRSIDQRQIAQALVERLAVDELLETLVDRACSADADTALRASEVLLVLGTPSVGALLRRLSAPGEPVTRSRLGGVILAMGEDAADALIDEIDRGDPARRRIALRLAGETQNPRLVPALRRVLLEGNAEHARDAAKALVQVADVAAYEALVESLRSPRPEVVQLGIYSLGRTGRSLFVAPLADVLERSLSVDAHDLAREAIRAMGRLGHPDATAPLQAILEQGGFFSRRRHRDLKLAAIGALRSLPGPKALAALKLATHLRDRPLRDAARSALERRTRAD